MKDYNINRAELLGRIKERGQYLNNERLQPTNSNFSVTYLYIQEKKLNLSITWDITTVKNI